MYFARTVIHVMHYAACNIVQVLLYVHAVQCVQTTCVRKIMVAFDIKKFPLS